MKPIWYFVGLILSLMGLVLFINGVYYLFNPDGNQTALRSLHPDIWWGGLMIVVGLIYIIKNRKVKIE
jgi:uncharacterized membrane protein HdeD (DUF308 family)